MTVGCSIFDLIPLAPRRRKSESIIFGLSAISSGRAVWLRPWAEAIHVDVGRAELQGRAKARSVAAKHPAMRASAVTSLQDLIRAVRAGTMHGGDWC